MSGLRAIISKFSDKDIRIIDVDNDLLLPVIDIAEAIGYDNDSMTRVIRRNAEVFEGFTRTVEMTVNGKLFTTRCVNESGLYLLFGKIDISRIKSEDAKDAIISFQRWIATTLKELRESRTVKITPMQTPGEVLKDEMSIAMMIQEYLGLDKTLFMVTAITRTEKQTGTSLVEYKNLLPPVVGPVAILTATEIGKQVDMQASKVNLKLAELGLHEKKGGIWTLTEAGKEYGAPFYENVNHGSGSTWQGVINKWSPKVIELIKDNA